MKRIFDCCGRVCLGYVNDIDVKYDCDEFEIVLVIIVSKGNELENKNE